MRPAAIVLLVLTALATGCARDAPTLSGSDRRACESFAARADSRGTDAYKRVFAECVNNTLHPQRGGG